MKEINEKDLEMAAGGSATSDRRKYNAATCPDYALKDKYAKTELGLLMPKDCVNCKNFTGDALTMCTIYPKDKGE